MTTTVGANSYATESQLSDYLIDRGRTLGTASAAVCLRRAMDYLETRQYVGAPRVQGQPLSWPRYGNGSADWERWPVDAYGVPLRIVQAQLAAAAVFVAGADLQAPVGPAIKRQKVGPVETEYQDGAASSKTYPAVDALLAPFLAAGGGAFDLDR